MSRTGRAAVLIVLVLAVSSYAGANVARAQVMPGMEEPDAEQSSESRVRTTGGPRSPEEKREALNGILAREAPTPLRAFYLKYLSEYSPYRGLGLAVITLIVLLVIRKYTTRLLRQYAQPRAHKVENVERFLKVWNIGWKVVIAVFVLMALTGSLRLLGLSAAFLGMMLGWSLQAPVTGLAAWLMIVLKRPFHIGDRVIIAGVTGDVSDITLTHVILNQVGGTVGGEEPSGRGVLIPNAILFGQVIMNYTLREQFVLDEVPIRLTFDSDWELAKRVMLQAARDATPDIIEKTGAAPFIRCEFFDAGVLVRLRYQSIPVRRQEISSTITEKVMDGFRAHYPALKFCYPHSVVQYRWLDQ